MNKSAIKTKTILQEATAYIQLIEHNVTGALGDFDSSLKAAQITIKTDVASVRDNIEQYVAFTNKKFAQISIFLRYTFVQAIKGRKKPRPIRIRCNILHLFIFNYVCDFPRYLKIYNFCKKQSLEAVLGQLEKMYRNV